MEGKYNIKWDNNFWNLTDKKGGNDYQSLSIMLGKRPLSKWVSPRGRLHDVLDQQILPTL